MIARILILLALLAPFTHGATDTAFVGRLGLLNGLVAYWPMSEASGTRYDVVGGNNLTPSGSPTKVAGWIGDCVSLHSVSSDYLYINDNAALSLTNEMTIAGWVRWISRDTVTDTKELCGKYVTTGNQRSYRLEWDASTGQNKIAFRISADGTNNTFVASTNYGRLWTAADSTNLTWYFIVAWKDSVRNVIGIQINGMASEEASFTGGIKDSTSQFAVGLNQASGTVYCDARVQHLGIWNRPLSASERSYLWNNGAGLAYPFNGATYGGAFKTLQVGDPLTTLYSVSRSECRLPGQRACFYSNGRWWAFFTAMTGSSPYHVKFTSSTDGVTWNTPTDETTVVKAAAQWDVVYDPTTGYLHFTRNIASNGSALYHDGLYYRRGAPQSDGTITWSAAWQTAMPTNNAVGDHTVCVDSSGHVWVGYCNNTDQVHGDAVVIKNSATDGTWSTEGDFPRLISSTDDTRSCTITSIVGTNALSTNGVYAITHRWNVDEKAHGYYFNGSGTNFVDDGLVTASNVESTSGDGAKVSRIGVEGDSAGTVHLAYQTDGQVIKYHSRSAAGVWGAEVQLADSTTVVDAISCPSAAFDGSGYLYYFWNGPSGNVYWVHNQWGSWSSAKALWKESYEATYEHIMPAALIQGNQLVVENLGSDFATRVRVVEVGK